MFLPTQWTVSSSNPTSSTFAWNHWLRCTPDHLYIMCQILIMPFQEASQAILKLNLNLRVVAPALPTRRPSLNISLMVLVENRIRARTSPQVRPRTNTLNRNANIVKVSCPVRFSKPYYEPQGTQPNINLFISRVNLSISEQNAPPESIFCKSILNLKVTKVLTIL